MTARFLHVSVISFVILGFVQLASALDVKSYSVNDPMEQAFNVRFGERLQVGNVEIPGVVESATLKLERFRVFAVDGQVVVHGSEGDTVEAVPRNAYLRGSVEGLPGSRVVLSVFPDGESRGVVSAGGRFWILGKGAAANAPSDQLTVREVNAEVDLGHKSQGYKCGTDTLESPADILAQSVVAQSKSSRPVSSAVAVASYTARMAIETDYQFYQKFGNVLDATNYIGDLIAYASTIYDAEVDTTLVVQSVSLWTTGAADDPWDQQASSLCQLFQYGRYWNDNNDAIDRTISFMLSGYNNNSGVAWVGVLCTGEFNYDRGNCSLTPQVDNYGGGHGYAGGIDGIFDINNPTVIWDIVAVSHEIGHMFNSPHTHCYGNVGGNVDPVDECNAGQCGSSGCFCGTPSLPGCNAGGGCGTIMSYCHLLSGGMGNLSLTFGDGHPFGVEPERVPTRMNAHVVSRAGSNLGCLDYFEPTSIFTDGFESGDTSGWSSTVAN
ncbi:MAG: hypothetical protein GY906_39970 [bacterium]|nr:hypothetical protein [bacterium]